MSTKLFGTAAAAAMMLTSAVGTQIDLGKMLSSIGFADKEQENAEGSESPSFALPPAPELAPATENDGELNAPLLPAPDIMPPQEQDAAPVYTVPPPQSSAPEDLAPQAPSPAIPSAQPNITSTAPLVAPLGTVDLEYLTSLQEANEPAGIPQPPAPVEAPAPVETPAIAPAPLQPQPLLNSYAVDPMLSTDHQGSSCDTGACSGEKVAPCYTSPLLPPPTNPVDMYRTPRCYNGLWATYPSEKACECRSLHNHLHDRCDCAEKAHRTRHCDNCDCTAGWGTCDSCLGR